MKLQIKCDINNPCGMQETYYINQGYYKLEGTKCAFCGVDLYNVYELLPDINVIYENKRD